MNIFYVDGEFVPETRAVIPVNDLVLLRGYGVFDFLRTYKRKPFYLKEHIKRLESSAKLIGLCLGFSQQEIFDIVIKTLAKNDKLQEANIRILVTGGMTIDFITPQNKPRLIVMVTPVTVFPEQLYTHGAAVVTTYDERYIPGSKSINYIPGILALNRACKQDAVESIYIDRYGRLLEGTTSNFFGFMDNKLITPGKSILHGITRQVVLNLAEKEFDIEIRDVYKEEIRLMNEFFICSSNKEIMPVVRVDDLVLSNGRPGEQTCRIMQMFKQYTCDYNQ
ncbi:Branched-chain amino acid aminotransferase [Desulfonema limicola]|uniref:branched-chain-amino-acid transaminase n=1 Tax=Desulfonema limicola TaxID=45656 RepID=A0A975GFT6_9BACT|nr:aminotransferase class IV [Desulfonema limicola]QTA79646.1 Branched-chain amino acid aminotransferase [Desulfonema limicola]